MYELTTIQKGMFWLWLAVSGNFVSETLSCKTQKLLNGNMYVKQILTFAILYFVTGFVDTSKHNPIEHLKLSAIIWVLFLLFTKMHIVPTIISFILICLSYLLNDYSSYYEKEGELEKSKKYKEISELILKVNIALIIVSFVVYLVSKYKEYKGKFNILTFILGKPNCKDN
jgi:hypothetical protein